MQGRILIGKTGQIRFKRSQAEQFGFEKDQRWVVGTDEEERPVKHIYILRPKPDQIHNGFKMQYQNKSWFISGNILIKELGLKPPLSCAFEPYKDDDFDGIRIILPS